MNLKVVPTCGSLVTFMFPPIIEINSLLITNPNPVPPYFLVWDSSAWENGLNKVSSLSLDIPIPVSLTLIFNVATSFFRSMQSMLTETFPLSVNLIALLKRFKNICLTRV